MTDAYDGNGDYSNYNNDEDNDTYGKRKIGSGSGGLPHNGDNSNHGLGGVVNISGNTGGSNINHSGPAGGIENVAQLNEKANEYIRDCVAEKNRMDRKYPISEKLLDCEIEKVQSTGRIPSREQKYADIYREKPLRISQKVLVPIREHPKFNFVGKLLGPKGNSLRRLQEETLCKMTVLGRNSMRDRVKEEELRASKDPKYAHLNNDLHVEISTIAPPAEAYARIAYAMAELRKYLIPDSNDIIRQEQLRELMDNTGITDSDAGSSKPAYKKLPQQQGMGSITSGMAGIAMGSVNLNAVGSNAAGSSLAGGGGGGGGSSNKNMHSSHHANAVSTVGSGGGGGTGVGVGGYRPTQLTNAFAKNVMAPKQKVMSILEKARTAMDETYGRGYDETLGYDQHSYESYGYGHLSQTNAMSGIGGMGSRGQYDTNDYEIDYNRRDYYQHSPNYSATGIAAAVSAAAAAAAQVVNQNTGLALNHNRNHVNR